VNALVGGRPAYVRALLGQVKAMQSLAAGDPISALAAALAGDGELAARCRFSYELRLHRARGYGALKAILDVLGEEEPLTLTHIAQRLGRTAGSTKDYLSWLQDVDLVACHQKRYTVADPVMRLWMRIHRGPAPADEERIATEVQTYSLSKLRAQIAAVPVGAGARANAADRSRTGIIEID
jgi:hypothetical protein